MKFEMFRSRYAIFMVCLAVFIFNQNKLTLVDAENTNNEDAPANFVEKSIEEIQELSSSEKVEYIKSLAKENARLKAYERDFKAIASVDLQQLPEKIRGKICEEIQHIYAKTTIP